jgi:hypothetical protein
MEIKKMITKQKSKLGIIVILSIFLASCESIPFLRHGHVAKLTPRQQLCASLRHQLIFENNPIGPNQLRSPPTHTARVMKEYQRYNCDDLLDSNVE